MTLSRREKIDYLFMGLMNINLIIMLYAFITNQLIITLIGALITIGLFSIWNMLTLRNDILDKKCKKGC